MLRVSAWDDIRVYLAFLWLLLLYFFFGSYCEYFFRNVYWWLLFTRVWRLKWFSPFTKAAIKKQENNNKIKKNFSTLNQNWKPEYPNFLHFKTNHSEKIRMGLSVENCLDPEYRFEDLICSICLDIMEHPAILPCSHKYCWKCINDISPKECALCRHEFQTKYLRKCKERWRIKSI